MAGEEVVQPADKAEEPDDAAKGIGELYELVDDAGEVNLSICGACKGLHDWVEERKAYSRNVLFLASFTC